MNAKEAIAALGSAWRPFDVCMLDIVTSCFRKNGHALIALKFFNEMEPMESMTKISYEMCKPECGIFNNVIPVMENALSRKEILDKITKGSLENANVSDVKKFLKHVRKNLRSPDGSKKLKNSKVLLQNYNNSLHIALYCSRALKKTVPAWICNIQPKECGK